VNLTWRRSGNPPLQSDIHAVCRDTAAGCRVELSGRITIDSTPGLQALLLKRLDSQDCKALTLDLYEVPYIDTAGLAMLMELLRAARLRGKQFGLSGVREKPRFLLEAARLLNFFPELDPDGRPGGESPYGGVA